MNINDVLDGHVALEVECVDRLYLNAYVPNLQVGGQVVRFLVDHLGRPVPSPALFDQIGNGTVALDANRTHRRLEVRGFE